MIALPPGVVFLFKAFVSLLTPPAVVYIAFLLLDAVVGLQVYRGVVWTCVVLTYPIRSFVDGKRLAILQRREMKSLGATKVPSWVGRWPGNFDLMSDLIERTKREYLGRPFEKYYDELGNTWRMDVSGKGAIFTVEPEHIKAILATQAEDFEKGDLIIDAAQDILGTGVFNSDGDMWKFHRAMTRPFFSRDRISHFNIFERHADRTLDLISNRLREGQAVDIQDAFLRFTMDSASEFLFGTCVHSLDDALPYPYHSQPCTASSTITPGMEFASAVSEVEDTLIRRVQLAFLWPLTEITVRKTIKPMKTIDAYLEPIISAAVARRNDQHEFGSIKKRVEVIEDNETLLDHLLKVTDDKKLLKDEVLNMMLAGRDTTASTLTFVTYMLCMHPDIASRLRTEILERVGSTRCPTYDDIRDMKFLRAVINETLRLYPVVPFNGRRSNKATVLKATTPGTKPFYVPAQTGLSYSVFIMQRRTDLWGPDALEFDPDRFLDERLHKYLTPNPFIFLPFNAGPRICLGQQFAYNEVSFMLVRLLQRFNHFELDSHAIRPECLPPSEWKRGPGRKARERIWPKASLTMYAYGGLWVRMRETTVEDE